MSLAEPMRKDEPTKPSRATRIEQWCAAGLLALCLAIGVYTLSDYSANWMHPEIYLAEQRHAPDIESMGLSSKAFHIARFADCHTLSDNCNRTRLMSYYVGYLNPFFRLWLEKYIAPHPSVSLTWLFSIATLFFLYRLVRNLTGDRSAALLTTALYSLSAGFLSVMVMLFNPAKPLASFFVCCGLYVAGLVVRGNLPWQAPLSWLLYVIITLGLFSDETAWLLPLYIVILFPAFLQRVRWPNTLCMFLTIPFFLGFVTWELPILARFIWRYDFVNLWGMAPMQEGLYVAQDKAALILKLLSGMSSIAYNMFNSEFAWWQSGTLIAVVSFLLLAIGIAVSAQYGRRDARYLLARTVLLLIVVSGFQCAVMAQTDTAAGTYYYDNLFPLFGVLVIGASFACLRGYNIARGFAVAVCIYLGYVSFTWFLSANREWIAGHELWYGRLVGEQFGPQHTPLSEAKVAALWRQASAGADVSSEAPKFAPKDLWLFQEMDILRHR